MDLSMATRKRAKAAIEWVTGIISLPGYVTGEGESYRPDVLIWIEQNGLVIGMDTAKPGVLIHRIAAQFRQVTRHPMIGPAHLPTRVRVASPEIAEALRAALGDTLDIVCAPTPEIDNIFASMLERMNEESGTQTYLTPGISKGAMAGFFRAAAELFRAKPWTIVPDDTSLLSITIDAFEVGDGVISTIGQAGESHGVIFFADITDFDAYLEAAAATERGEEPEMPSHFAINFDSDAELAPAALAEIAEHGWEIAGPLAYPSLIVVDNGVIGRPPTEDELTLSEAIALALPKVLCAKQVLLKAWKGGKPFSRTLTVTTHAGPVEVTVGVLHETELPEPEASAPTDVIRALADLRWGDDGFDSKARALLEQEVLTRFDASPEAEPLEVIETCQLVMDFAASYFGETIATLTAAHLREIVFEIIPRKLMTDASEADPIVVELCAFFAFLKREFGLAQAGALLAVLGGDAIPRLTRALADPRNFGMAKSLMMAGRGAGFDVSSKQGVEAWMHEIEGKPLPPSIHLPSIPGAPPRAVDPEVERAWKNKRKAEKKARKNR